MVKGGDSCCYLAGNGWEKKCETKICHSKGKGMAFRLPLSISCCQDASPYVQKNAFQKFAANQSGERVGGIFVFLELWGDYETICIVPRQGSHITRDIERPDKKQDKGKGKGQGLLGLGLRWTGRILRSISKLGNSLGLGLVGLELG